MAVIRIPATTYSCNKLTPVTNSKYLLRTVLNGLAATITNKYSENGNLGIPWVTLSFDGKLDPYVRSGNGISITSYSIQIDVDNWDLIRVYNRGSQTEIVNFDDSVYPNGVTISTISSPSKSRITISSSLLPSGLTWGPTIQIIGKTSGDLSVYGVNIYIEYTVNADAVAHTLSCPVMGSSKSSTVTVTNAYNAYSPVDSSSYATYENVPSSGSQVGAVVIFRQFDYSYLPSDAVITSIVPKIKVRASGVDLSTNFNGSLPMPEGSITSIRSGYFFMYDVTDGIYLNSIGTSLENDADPAILYINGRYTSKGGVALDPGTLLSYDSDLGVKVIMYNDTAGESSYLYVYGVELTVTYVTLTEVDVTTTLKLGDGEIDPEGTEQYYEENDYILVVTPTDTDDTVKVIKDKAEDVSSLLVPHYAGSTSVSMDGMFTFINTTSASGVTLKNESTLQDSGEHSYSDDYTMPGSMPYSSSQSDLATFQYDSDSAYAVLTTYLTSVKVYVKACPENYTKTTEHLAVRPYIEDTTTGTIVYADTYDWVDSGTNDPTVHEFTFYELPSSGQWQFGLVCQIGYYGGFVYGMTFVFEYADPTSGISYYELPLTVGDSDMTVDVYIGESFTPASIYGVVRAGSPDLVPETADLLTGVSTFVGAEMMLKILPYLISDKLRVVKNTTNVASNAVDITNQLVPHDSGSYYTYVFTATAYTAFEIYDLATESVYFKENGSYVEAIEVYRKVNGAWVLQDNIFSLNFNMEPNCAKAN